MKLRLPFACFLLFLSCSAPAQLAAVGVTPDQFYGPLYVTDINGKIIPANQPSDVEGTPLLSNDWNLGYVKLDAGKKADSIQLKFNLQSNRLYFLRNEETFEFVDAIREFSFSFKENELVKTVLFRNNYPAIEKNNTASYYEVLAEGPRVQLLRYKERMISEIYVFNRPPRKEYTETSSLYIYDAVTKSIQKVKVKRSSITGALPGLEKSINELCDKNKWDMKSIDELKLLVQAL